MAKKKQAKKETISDEQKWGIGVGLTAAAVTAVGAYFLYGSKDAEKNRRKVKSWMLRAKAEVLESLEHAQEMSKEEYEELINTIAAAYADVQDASKKDIREFKEEMKAHWGNIEKLGKKAPKKAAKKVKAVAKKAKKVAKKSAKKTTAKKAAKKAATKKTA